MSTVPVFAKLNCGATINLGTKLNVRGSKKSNEKKTRALTHFREHFRTGEINLPEITVKDLGDLFRKVGFEQKEKFFRADSVKNDDLAVEYDLDEEDFKWIKSANEQRKKDSVSLINLEKFEVALDRMEKKCTFEPRGGTGMQVNSDDETDDVCCVCQDGDVSNANQIIYCDMCNIAVHQDCYGVPYIPEGSWVCRRCKLSPSVSVKCCLCPNEGGAFKQTSDGRWAHVVCAIWLNEVHFGNAVFLEPIEGVNETLTKRKILRCLYCRNKHGACLQCSSRMCFKAFHVTCARQLGLMMTVETDLDPPNKEEEEVDVKRYVYCQKHASGNNMTNKEFEKSIRNARRTMEASSSQKPTILMPSLSRVNMDEIAKETGIAKFEDVVAYWYMKRQCRAGVPLIKRLISEVVPKHRKHTSSSTGLNEEDRKNAETWRIIRNSLETARLLSEQTKKREMHKKAQLKVMRPMIDCAFMPIDRFLLKVWEKLEAKDSKKVFATPVKLEGYSNVIKNPMDLQTMKNKILKFKYSSVADLRKDVMLMTENCIKFNHDNEYYLRYGRKYRKAVTTILNEEEEMAKSIEKLQNNETSRNNLLNEIFDCTFDKAVLDSDLKVVVEEVSDSGPPRRRLKFEQPSTSKDAGDMGNTSSFETPSTLKNRRGRGSGNVSTISQNIENVQITSPIERDEQEEEDDDKEDISMKPSTSGINPWRSLFTGASSQQNSNKRKNSNLPTTTPKRKKETGNAASSILPFLTASSEPRLTFSSVAKNSSSTTPLSPRTSRISRNGMFSGSFRESSVRSPMMADTASSTEYSTDDEVIEVKHPKTNKRTTNGSSKTHEKKKNPRFPKASQKHNESPIEKAKIEASSIFAHNAIVNVDGKAAKVIDMQYAHLSDISREQRQQMITSRPSKVSNGSSTRNGGSSHNRSSGFNGNQDDDRLVYVEFFQKSSNTEQYKWVPSERVTLIDLSNTSKSKIVGLKAAKEWQQNILNK